MSVFSVVGSLNWLGCCLWHHMGSEFRVLWLLIFSCLPRKCGKRKKKLLILSSVASSLFLFSEKVWEMERKLELLNLRFFIVWQRSGKKMVLTSVDIVNWKTRAWNLIFFPFSLVFWASKQKFDQSYVFISVLLTFLFWYGEGFELRW